jgi:hypothetical protein
MFPSIHLLEEWPSFVNEPLSILDSQLKDSKLNGPSNQTDIMLLHNKVSSAVDQIDSENLSSIPLVNAMSSFEGIKNRSLVRFRGMIQDMFDPEFYLAFYQTHDVNDINKKNHSFGLYRSSLPDELVSEIDHDAESNILSDRMSYLTITVPGENKWVYDKYVDDKSSDEEMSNETPSVISTDPGSASDQDNSQNCQNLESCFPLKRLPVDKVCVIKVYTQTDSKEEERLRLNDMIEVIGVIDFTSRVKGEEEDKHHFSLPPSLCPDIHALRIKKIKHLNPILYKNATFSTKISPSSDNNMTTLCEKMRRELHAILSQCLFDDDLAADYVICCLISRVYSRKDIRSLGSFPVGISNFPKEMTQAELSLLIKSIYQLISGLVTHSHYFPLSLENLNGKNILPKKDYTVDKLVSGQLQLSSGCVLFVDETVMKTGQLSPQGVTNLTSVGNLIKWQQLKYDFEYHSLDIDTDIPVIVFSEGKSLLPVVFRVPLKVRVTFLLVSRRLQILQSSIVH